MTATKPAENSLGKPAPLPQQKSAQTKRINKPTPVFTDYASI